MLTNEQETNQRLSDLYYRLETQPDRIAGEGSYRNVGVRVWSSANWQDWGTAIRNTRLEGKLAMTAHLDRLGEEIFDRLNRHRVGDASMTLYLIAHLHDPYASGALFDLAYFLQEKIALRIGLKLYGLLILPGAVNDPLKDRDDLERRWYFANAYAALRELYFFSSERSFYQNHHPDLRVDIKVEDLSPFQQGDSV